VADALLLRSGGDLLLHGTVFTTLTSIDTGTYAPHPVNCQIAGNTPLPLAKIVSWRSGPKDSPLTEGRPIARLGTEFRFNPYR